MEPLKLEAPGPDVLGPGQIVWLASYPKSGNTWLRSLLTCCLLAPGQRLDINQLAGQGAASREALDDLLGIATGDCTADEVRRLLPLAYRAWSGMSGGPHFLKTHDAYALTPASEPLFPSEATRCVVHIVRDPRDVAVSAMHHWGLSLEDTLARMNNRQQWVATRADLAPTVPQHLSDWSGHADSWMGSGLPRLTLRYEDLRADPAGVFRRVVAYIGLAVPEDRLHAALDACALENLQAQERASSFRERQPGSTAPFFRSGRVGGWRSVLTAEQARCLVAAHGSMMERLGYAT